MKIQLDMYQTMAVAVVVLMLGSYLRKKIDILERFCIPAPVVGGFLFAIFTCICYATGILEFEFDDILKEVCMVFFFTSVGFQANLKVLKKGGKSLIVFLGLVIVLIFTQNFVAVGLSKLLGLNSLIGMCTGSIPMVGGHGTAGAFGPVLEDFNVQGATTICTAAATFGLIFGSIIGGPLGKRLIEKKDLLKTAIPEDDSLLVEDEKKHERHTQMYAAAVFQLIIAIGIGTVFSWALTQTGMTFPIYIGAMIAAALMRNIAEYAGNDKFVIHMGEINDLGGIALSLFLGMAMITLKLWQLASLALPLVILLVAQTILMFLKLAADPEKQLASIEYWIMGSLNGISRDSLAIPFFTTLAGFIIMAMLYRQVLILSTSEEEAVSLGVNVTILRFIILMLATLVVSSIICVTGLISFIGLIAPHIARLLTKRNDIFTYITSGFTGAILLTLADILARSVSTSELPVSIFTSLLGAPLLIILLIRANKKEGL